MGKDNEFNWGSTPEDDLIIDNLEKEFSLEKKKLSQTCARCGYIISKESVRCSHCGVKVKTLDFFLGLARGD